MVEDELTEVQRQVACSRQEALETAISSVGKERTKLRGLFLIPGMSTFVKDRLEKLQHCEVRLRIMLEEERARCQAE